MKFRTVLRSALIGAATALGSLHAAADSVPLPGVQYNGHVQYGYFSGNTQLGDLVTFDGSDIIRQGSDQSSAKVSAASSLNPVATLNVSGSIDTFGATNIAFSVASISQLFAFEVCFMSGGCGVIAPISGGVTVNAFGTASGTSNAASLLSLFQIETSNGSSILSREISGGPGSWTLNTNLTNLSTGTIYYVLMQVAGGVTASHGSGSYSAMVDPMFTVQPDLYSLQFSPGVVNGDFAATPLPAALPLFATGLAGFGWLARRRKQKQLAA